MSPINFCSSSPVAFTSRAPVLHRTVPWTHSWMPKDAAIARAQEKLSTPARQNRTFCCNLGMTDPLDIEQRQTNYNIPTVISYRRSQAESCRSITLAIYFILHTKIPVDHFSSWHNQAVQTVYQQKRDRWDAAMPCSFVRTWDKTSGQQMGAFCNLIDASSRTRTTFCLIGWDEIPEMGTVPNLIGCLLENAQIVLGISQEIHKS